MNTQKGTSPPLKHVQHSIRLGIQRVKYSHREKKPYPGKDQKMDIPKIKGEQILKNIDPERIELFF